MTRRTRSSSVAILTARFASLASPIGLAVLLAFALPQSALAKKPKRGPGFAKAMKLFKKGIQLFDKGYYMQAVAEFRAAKKFYKSPKLDLRIALCFKWLAQPLTSLRYYEKFLAATKGSKNPKDKALRKQVLSEVAKLREAIVRVAVAMPAPAGAEVRINGKLIGEAPLNKTVRLLPGQLTVTALAKGHHPFSRTVTAKGGQRVAVRIMLIKIKPKVIRKVVNKVVHIRDKPIYRRWWFWTVISTLVAGGAAAGLGVAFGTKTIRRAPEGDLLLRHSQLPRL